MKLFKGEEHRQARARGAGAVIAAARWLLPVCALAACLGARARKAPVAHRHSPFIQSMLAGPVTPDLPTLLAQVHLLRLAV
jgi:hypothetical protein